MLPKLPHRDVNLYSPLALSFLGDSVYEIYVRTRLVSSANMPVRKLHSLAVGRVCCEYQARALKALCDSGFLTEEEQYIVRRGQNANGVSPPKHSTAKEYRMATGLECLFGFLYLEGRTDRLDEIFEFICKTDDSGYDDTDQ